MTDDKYQAECKKVVYFSWDYSPPLFPRPDGYLTLARISEIDG